MKLWDKFKDWLLKEPTTKYRVTQATVAHHDALVNMSNGTVDYVNISNDNPKCPFNEMRKVMAIKRHFDRYNRKIDSVVMDNQFLFTITRT